MKKAISISEQPRIIGLVKRVYFGLALLIGLLIVLKSLDYYSPNFDKGFLIGKSAIFTVYKFFLYGHIIGAPVALLTGLFQFSFKRSGFHRIIGIIYIGSILLLAGPGGMGMSFYAMGGAINVINFLLMSSVWILTTYLAWHYAKRKEYQKHQSMMTRSFILTNSAILIRLFSYINHELLLFKLELGYIIISWTSWLPALLIYEIWSFRKQRIS